MSGSAAPPASVEIGSLSHDGRGVAHVDGKALFVSGALPGERVSVRQLKRRRQYDEALLESIEQPSPSRVTPRCAHFGVCGGCALQHLDPAAQLIAKQTQLAEELRRIAKLEPDRWLAPLSGNAWGYRRRARLSAKYVARKERVLVGFRERQSPYIAELRRCEILAAPLDGLIEPLGELLTGLSIRARVPQIEASVADNVTALVLRVLDPPSSDDLDRLREFAARHTLQLYLQPGDARSVRPLTEAQPLHYRLAEFDLQLQFEPTDFVQINADLNRRMVLHAVDLLAPQPDEQLLDLFCGLGNFSLALARRVARVVGVEGDAGLVERARANALRNGLDNASFHLADLSATDLELPWSRQAYDAVLLDPPRAGAKEVLALIDRSRARRVVYISCHPGSLARDAAILAHELGFRLEAAGVMDMFPHTTHLESIALFTRDAGRSDR